MIPCKICNKNFEPLENATKICSKDCRKEASRISREKWRSKTPDHKKLWATYTYKWRESNPIRAKITSTKARAKKENIPFNLTEDDIVVPEFCPVLGIKLISTNFNNRPEIDRIVPELGYVKENIRIISGRANRLKNNGTIEEFEKILAYMKNNS